MEAHRTIDPFQVMKISDHKTKQSIMFYIELEKVVFEFTVGVANNVGEACEPTEAGFEHVTGEYDDSGKSFKAKIT